MSGIYITNMEMPENCHECELVDVLVNCPCRMMSCDEFWGNSSLAVEGHKDCPLIPVPDHGRLGDLDDVINDVRHYLCEGCWDYFGLDAKTESCDYCGVMKLIKAIERKPSIIQADKEGKR